MATYFKGTTPLPSTPFVGGSSLKTTMLGGESLQNGFTLGQEVGGGIVYKIFGGGVSAMVFAPEFWSAPGPISTFAWETGFCSSGTNFPASSTDGQSNTFDLWNASIPPCNFQAGFEAYEQLNVTGSTFRGESRWYIPASEELQEISDSGYYTMGNKVLSSTGASNPNRGVYLENGILAQTSGTEQDYRLILVRRI